MFGFNKQNKSPDQFAQQVGNAPITAYQRAEKRYFEAHGSPKVEASRWFLFSVVLLIVLILQGVAIYQMLPLKTAVPYMVTLSRDKGVSAEVVEAKNFRPDENVKIFFLTKFVDNMRTLDPYLTQENLRNAFQVCRDKAVAEFTDFLNTEKPIQKLMSDKSLLRTLKFITVNPGTQDNIAFIRVKEVERTGAKESSKTYMFTIHYQIIPPTTFEMIQKNPAGIYVTHFDKREEVETN